MDYRTFNDLQTAFPDDIATALLDEIAELIAAGAIDADLDTENYNLLYDDIVRCIFQVLGMAENPYNADYWRTFYKILSDISENRG